MSFQVPSISPLMPLAHVDLKLGPDYHPSPLPDIFNALNQDVLKLSLLENQASPELPAVDAFATIAGRIFDHLTALSAALPEGPVSHHHLSVLSHKLEMVQKGSSLAMEDTAEQISQIVGPLFGDRIHERHSKTDDTIISSFPEPDIEYESHYEGNIIDADPEGLGMEWYRWAEERSWLLYLGQPHKTRLFLGPSVWGAGKATHIIPALEHELDIRELKVVRVSARESSGEGLKGEPYLRSVLDKVHRHKARKPDVILIDDFIPYYIQTPRRQIRFRQLIEQCLELPDTRVALFGGGFETTRHQVAGMKEILQDVIGDNDFVIVGAESKSLNAQQTFEVLTKNFSSEDDDEAPHSVVSRQSASIYFDVISRKIPHTSLKAVRPWALPQGTASLRDGFVRAIDLMQDDERLVAYFDRIATYPRGGNKQQPLTTEFLDLQVDMVDDIQSALLYSGEIETT